MKEKQLPLLDEIDKTILRILQRDSKQTAKQIAAHLNLTTSPVYERIRNLERNGFIKKYVAILDKTLIERSITAICLVSMQSHNEDFIQNFEQTIRTFDEVQECYHMAGPVDFILKIHVESLETYHEFIKYKLSKIANIGTLNTSFALKEIKQSSEFYI